MKKIIKTLVLLLATLMIMISSVGCKKEVVEEHKYTGTLRIKISNEADTGTKLLIDDIFAYSPGLDEPVGSKEILDQLYPGECKVLYIPCTTIKDWGGVGPDVGKVEIYCRFYKDYENYTTNEIHTVKLGQWRNDYLELKESNPDTYDIFLHFQKIDYSNGDTEYRFNRYYTDPD